MRPDDANPTGIYLLKVKNTSLFSVVHNPNTTAKDLNNDLVKIRLTNGK